MDTSFTELGFGDFKSDLIFQVKELMPIPNKDTASGIISKKARKQYLRIRRKHPKRPQDIRRSS